MKDGEKRDSSGSQPQRNHDTFSKEMMHPKEFQVGILHTGENMKKLPFINTKNS